MCTAQLPCCARGCIESRHDRFDAALWRARARATCGSFLPPRHSSLGLAESCLACASLSSCSGCQLTRATCLRISWSSCHVALTRNTCLRVVSSRCRRCSHCLCSLRHGAALARKCRIVVSRCAHNSPIIGFRLECRPVNTRLVTTLPCRIEVPVGSDAFRARTFVLPRTSHCRACHLFGECLFSCFGFGSWPPLLGALGKSRKKGVTHRHYVTRGKF